MNIVRIINTHKPIWSTKEILIITVILLIAFLMANHLYRKKMISCRQAIYGILLLLYLITVLGSTVFTRVPGERKYQLELFWSWKEILHSAGRIGTMSQKSLFLQNILNMILLFPAGIFLPQVFGCRIRWYRGLLFGILFSTGIELLQLLLCRGLFEFDDIIHNGFGCMAGTLLGNIIWQWQERRKKRMR